MPTFRSRPLRRGGFSSRILLPHLLPSIRRRPFLLFGLPFTLTILSGAYGLSYLTQTRYEYNATKVQTVSKEEELGMKKGRKRIDLREEYWKLSRGRDELSLDADASVGSSSGGKDHWSEWEPKRIPRPPGVEEWGDPSASASSLGASHVEQADNTRDNQRQKVRKPSFSLPGLASLHAEGQAASGSALAVEMAYDMSNASPPDARGNRIVVTESGKKVVIGPDGKPCKACNSRLALREAMKGVETKGASPSSSDSTTKTKSKSTVGFLDSAMSTVTSSSSPLPCPPDVEELGRSSWDLLHSIAATYPERPTVEEQTALLGLLKALPLLYPCRWCAQALQEEYTRRDNANDSTSSAEAVARAKERRGEEEIKADNLTISQAITCQNRAIRFTCSIHNDVNERLGKPKWDCEDVEKLKERWNDGGKKCF